MLDLRTPKGKPARWTLILGENGVGKTSLLECMAATVPRLNVDDSTGERRTFLEAAGVIDDVMIEKLARHGSVEVEIRATYAKNDRLDASGRKAKTFDVGFASPGPLMVRCSNLSPRTKVAWTNPGAFV